MVGIEGGEVARGRITYGITGLGEYLALVECQRDQEVWSRDEMT